MTLGNIRVVTMPQDCWNDVAVILLEQVRTLRREGREDLVETLLDDLLPPLLSAVSPEVLGLIAEMDYRPRKLAASG